MDNNRIEGIARQAKGTIKEAAGKITGNDKLQAEGKAEKLAGQAQEKYTEKQVARAEGLAFARTATLRAGERTDQAIG